MLIDIKSHTEVSHQRICRKVFKYFFFANNTVAGQIQTLGKLSMKLEKLHNFETELDDNIYIRNDEGTHRVQVQVGFISRLFLLVRDEGLVVRAIS